MELNCQYPMAKFNDRRSKMIQASHSHNPEHNLNIIQHMVELASQPVTMHDKVITVHAKQLERINYSLQANIKKALAALPEGYTVKWVE